jgi:hypothetical protein
MDASLDGSAVFRAPKTFLDVNVELDLVPCEQKGA